MTHLQKKDAAVEPAEVEVQIKDVFSDPSKLRLSQNFVETVGVKKILTHVPVGRPNKQEFFRVRTESEFRSNYAFIEVKADNEFYLVMPDIVAALSPAEYRLATLYTVITRGGVLLLWPVPIPDADGKINDWHRAAHEAAQHAMSAWVRATPNRALGAYDIHLATGPIPEPVWPAVPLEELLRIAFRRFLVDTLDHPLLKRLRGEC